MIYFLIPAYNEEQNLKKVLPAISKTIKQNHHFIIVDDGSTDNTNFLLTEYQKSYSLSIIKHHINMGVTKSFFHGFETFLKSASFEDILITMEADSTSSIDILHKMIENLSNHDVVLASCYMKEGTITNTNFSRKVISFFANLLMRSVFPELRNLHTVSSFYRSFRYSIIDKYWKFYQGQELTENSFACVIEMLIKLKRIDADIIEIPMILDTGSRIGPSKMPKLKTVRGYLKLIYSLKLKPQKIS